MDKTASKEKVKNILHSLIKDFDYYTDENYMKEYILYLLDKDPYIEEKGIYYVKRILSIFEPPIIFRIPKTTEEQLNIIVENIKTNFSKVAKKYNIDAQLIYDYPNFYLQIHNKFIEYQYDYQKIIELIVNYIIENLEYSEIDFFKNPEYYLTENISFVEWMKKTILENVEPSNNLKEFYSEIKNLILKELLENV